MSCRPASGSAECAAPATDGATVVPAAPAAAGVAAGAAGPAGGGDAGLAGPCAQPPASAAVASSARPLHARFQSFTFTGCPISPGPQAVSAALASPRRIGHRSTSALTQGHL